jgi:hypothetical protein
MPNIVFETAMPIRALPSKARMALNFSKAAGAIILEQIKHPSEPLAAPENVQAGRLAQCRACEFYLASDQRCSLCGCFTAGWVFNKVKYAVSTCPAKPPKWGPCKGE